MRRLPLTFALALSAACAPVDDTDRDVASSALPSETPGRLALTVTVGGQVVVLDLQHNDTLLAGDATVTTVGPGGVVHTAPLDPALRGGPY